MDSRKRFGAVGRPGSVGRVAVAWPGYPEPVPETCLNAGNFYKEWMEANDKIWAEAEKEAEQKLKDPKNTCGKSKSPATKVTVKDCTQELYEPRHDQMVRDLIAKYDCEPGGSGAVEPGNAGSDGGGSSSSGSGSSNVLLYGVGAALVLGGVGWYFLRGKVKANPVYEDNPRGRPKKWYGAYEIVRFSQHGPPRVVDVVATRQAAQKRCSDPEGDYRTATSKAAKARTKRSGPWYEGFQKHYESRTYDPPAWLEDEE